MNPSVLKLNLPEDGPPMSLSEKKTLNLVLGNHIIGYYLGTNTGDMHFTNYSPNGIRTEIQKMQEKIAHSFGDKSQLYITIKPTKESSYKNVVDILDEMLINNVNRYVLTEADDKESGILKN